MSGNVYLIKSSDGVTRRIAKAQLIEHFEYFNHTASDLDTRVYELPFLDEVISKLEDAIVCRLFPLMSDDDLELIDYLQPLDNIKTYMCYSLNLTQGSAVGASLDTLDEGEVDKYLFTDALEDRYLNYLRHLRIDEIRSLPEVDKNLEALYHSLVIARRGCQGDEDRVVDVLEKVPNLVRKWYGREKEGDDLDMFYEAVLELAYERVVGGELSSRELYDYVRALCPYLCYDKDVAPTLPWGVMLDEDDERVKNVAIVAHGRISLKKSIPAPVLPYDYEFDNDS